MGDYYKNPENGKTYRLGKPSLLDRIKGGPSAYAYGRFSRDPIEYKKGPLDGIFAPILGTQNHEGFNQPGILGGRSIKVRVDKGDVDDTVYHEQLHSAFPIFNDRDVEEGRVRALLDPNARKTVRSMIKPEEADTSLIDKILSVLNGSGK